MATPETFTDSTDWLSTPLAALASVDASLRCQVCKDFFTTPMITSCSHTFCSLCIRRYLSQEGRCPACRESDQEIKLRRNWSVEESVAQFTAGRKELLEVARRPVGQTQSSEGPRPKKRRKLEHSEALPERRNTRSQSKRLAGDGSQNGYTLPSSQEEEVQDSDGGSVYADEPAHPKEEQPHDGLVACPCCGRRMKEALINAHLDKCIAGEATPSPRRSNTPQIPSNSIAYGQTKPIQSLERLPTINYSMLNDNALRKKLKELGIPNHGSKELMRKRHTEWINLWNANCDSLRPVSKKQLLQDLDKWEKTLGRQIDRGPNGVMVKEFDRDGWQKTNKSDFDDLIRRAREKKNATVSKTEETQKADGVEPEPSRRSLENIFSPVDEGTEEVIVNGHHDNSSADTPMVDHVQQVQTLEPDEAHVIASGALLDQGT